MSKVKIGSTALIANLTECRIIDAFFGEDAKPYLYEVTAEDFDEYDNEGPGEYSGIEVPHKLADKWDAGLRACKAAGVHHLSRAGLTLRYREFHGDSVVPSSLLEVADERAARLKEKEEAKAAEIVRRESLDNLRRGAVLELSHVSVYVVDALKDRLLAIGVTNAVHPKLDGLERLADTGKDFKDLFRFYRLLNGDIMETCPGQATRVFSRDRELIDAYTSTIERIHGADERDTFRRFGDKARRTAAEFGLA